MRNAKKPKDGAKHQQEQNGGRPRIEIDLVQVERLATIQCTDQEIAAVLGVSHDTIGRRKIDDPSFAKALEEGRSKGVATLRRLQWQRAQGGSDTMLIWLGKNVMGQTDKAMIGGDPDNPMKTEVRYTWDKPPPE